MSTRNQRAKRARRGDRSFQPSSAGKGDQDRTTDVDAYRANYDEINWGHSVSKAELQPLTSQKIKQILDDSREKWDFDWSQDQ